MVRDQLDKIRDLSDAKPYFGMMGNVVEKLRENGSHQVILFPTAFQSV